MKTKAYNKTEINRLKRRILRKLGEGFYCSRFDLDRTFNGLEFVNNNLLLMGSSTLKKLMKLGIPFNVGHLNHRFCIIFYLKYKSGKK